ncbi:response regulator [Aquimarina sp. U1-2]|uniref:hybrid sensor histidine kinase/response regulator n=1 Tax=Aquimarina sp. U1-2 TaxID=2823141 RepID=UPI001AECFD90|nr:response regulator [Aquimarina sp. U1-2]MBP2831648.1 response regulator [Aquimarina sp. U1-2]
MHRSLFFLFLIFFSTKSFDQNRYDPQISSSINEQWRWTHFDDLQSYNITCLTQSNDNTLWFGGTTGVVAYNGYDWNFYEKPEALASQNIQTLHASCDNAILVGTNESIYFLKNGKWQDYLAFSFLPLNFHSIVNMPDGSIFAGFGDLHSELSGLVHIQEQNYRFYVSAKTKTILKSFKISSSNIHVVADHLTLSDTKGNRIFNVQDIFVDNKQTLYVGISNEKDLGKIAVFDYSPTSKKITLRKYFSEEFGLKIRGYIDIAASDEGDIWVVSEAHDLGVNFFDGKRWETIKLSTRFGGVDAQKSVLIDSKNSVWIEGHGRIFQQKNNTWQVFENPEIPVATSSRLLFHESFDKQIWVVEELSGVYKFDNTFQIWSTYENLNYQFENDKDEEWFLTVEGQAVVHRNDQWFSYGRQEGMIDTPVKLFKTSYGEIWALGSHQESAAAAYFSGEKWFLKTFPELSWGINQDAIFESFDGSLWLGCSVDLQPDRGHKGGILQLLSPQKNKTDWIHHLPPSGTLNSCYGIGESPDEVMWFGGKILWEYNGMKWNKDHKNRFLNDPVDCVENDNTGNLWLGTRHYGIFCLKKGQWINYTINEGLPDNNIIDIFAENEHRIWAITHRGMSYFDGHSWASNVFPTSLFEHPESNEIEINKAGQFWFNQSFSNWKRRGLSKIKDAQKKEEKYRSIHYKPNNYAPETKITVFNNQVDESGNTAIFWEGNDHFKITPDKDLRYSFRLNQGSWSPWSTNKYHKFSGLDSGAYRLEVRSIDSELNIESSPASVTFNVLPLWWKRPELIGFVIMILGIIFYLLQRTIKNYYQLKRLTIVLKSNAKELQHKNEKIELQRDQLKKTIKKVEHLSLSRLQFFTNVSHEFRTPLTLILGPAEELLDTKARLNKQVKEKYYKLIHSNASRILKLVNQILEVYKVKESTLSKKLVEGDLIAHITEIINLFRGLSIRDGIKISVHSSVTKLFTNFDPDKIEKIITNLLTNAIKNVSKSEKGVIQVFVQLDIQNKTLGKEGVLKIIVTDNGKGISSTELDTIFERFYTSDTDHQNAHAGIGIGLSYIKDLVTTLGGNIEVTSVPNIKTSFIVNLPYIRIKDTSKNKIVAKNNANVFTKIPTPKRAFAKPSNLSENSDKGGKQFTLLIVEDNQELRAFIKDCFLIDFNIIEANNGKEAINLIDVTHPDLIISDVMMPEINGIELCQRLKSELDTCHIPIILLTAKTQTEDKIEGYDNGADAYLEKPFNKKVLRSYVYNLLKNRNLLKERFKIDLDLKPQEMKIASLDEIFIKKILDIIQQNMDNTQLNAEMIAKEIGVSRVQLYRKVKVITNQTVNEFIKSERLKQAAKLLQERKFNISQIAYYTGFSAPNHFSTHFRKHFGITPSEFLNQYAPPKKMIKIQTKSQ